MQTDIMLHFKNGKTLIIDAKYYGQTMQYHFNKATIHSHNLYQIHTYVMNQDVEHKGEVDGMLLYAKTEEECEIKLAELIRVMKAGIKNFK